MEEEEEEKEEEEEEEVEDIDRFFLSQTVAFGVRVGRLEFHLKPSGSIKGIVGYKVAVKSVNRISVVFRFEGNKYI